MIKHIMHMSHGGSPLPNDVVVDNDDELLIFPPSTPVLSPTSVIGSVSQGQSQSQSQPQPLIATFSKQKYSAQGDQLSASTLSSGK
jgi:hypothetical protein